jgi:asparagine synthase (glutamine-hydrolysing)
MCGLVGLYTQDLNARVVLVDTIQAMADCIAHRGPDDFGVWADDDNGIGLGHRRLSILDLSPAGHQPMLSVSGRFVLAYNGEIYNHLEIRERLLAENCAPAWRGHSDTETLLAAIEAWGLDKALQASTGMFAIALWDKQEKTLQLARDRFGEKPLYYGWVDDAFVFASELKAVHAVPGYQLRINREALALYMRFCYVPAPLSIHQDLYKLEPGCVLQISGVVPVAAKGPMLPGERYESISIRRWWSFRYTAAAGIANPFHDEAEALQALELALSKSVQQQSLADVPLGAFLSGGVDSSLIVALMQKQSIQPVKSFTIGFEDPNFDESDFAKAVAQHLGTEHQTLMVTSADAQAVIPKLGRMYDEPFADSSQIPTYLVCQAARKHVTVALSGDAGDELFGGYNRYFWGPKIWDKISWMPYPARRAAGSLIQSIPANWWDGLSDTMPERLSAARMGDKAHRLGARLSQVRNADNLYESLVSEWHPSEAVVRNAPSHPFDSLALIRTEMPAVLNDKQSQMMYKDTLSYLPDDILCKVDRAAMAVSLETRVPFLDQHIVELAWRLPMNMKIRGHQGKWALRQVLYKHVPRELIERPKAGFGIPVGNWLRGPLRDWAEALLDETRLQNEGYFNPQPIRRKWHQHLSGRFDYTVSLWCVLMFQAWLEEQV